MFVDDERDTSGIPDTRHLILLQRRGLAPACFRLDGKELPFVADKKIRDATLSKSRSSSSGFSLITIPDMRDATVGFLFAAGRSKGRLSKGP